MSHPRELIETIRALITQDYPEGAYRYSIERAIPGTRLFPDILVSSRSGEMICAIEIGYTRPEKLTKYRSLGIPDVRWYSKDGDLHSGWEIKNVKAKVTLEGGEPDWVYFYLLHELVDCHSDECASWLDDEDDELYEDNELELSEGVVTVLLTDYLRFWLPSFCDKCGETWLAGHRDGGEYILRELGWLTPTDFGRVYGARTILPWNEATAEARDFTQAEFDWTAFDLVRRDDENARARLDKLLRDASRAVSVELIDVIPAESD